MTISLAVKIIFVLLAIIILMMFITNIDLVGQIRGLF